MNNRADGLKKSSKSSRSDLGYSQGRHSVILGSVNLIAGNSDTIPQVFALLQEADIATEANSDLYVREYRQFGIDDAHELRARASSRAIGTRRVFVVIASNMTNEAQNALLKTLEEPPADALFLFVVPAPETLLATVRSRGLILRLAEKDTPVPKGRLDAKAFFASTPAKRLDMLKLILMKDDDDKYDTGAILAFLSSLEESAAHIKNRMMMRDALDALYRTRMYIADRGALVKALLESVALVLPQI